MGKNLLKVGMVLFMFFLASAGEAKIIEVPLYELAPVKTIDLKGPNAQYGIKLPISERWKVKKAVLHFTYVNSSALSPQNSRLVIKLNGYPLAQIRLSPIAPQGEVDVLLPGQMLKPGYNELTFYVSQHYTLGECEDPSAPELWTTLKLDEAYLKVDYTLKPVPLKLSSISHFLFDPKIFPSGRVNIIMEKPTAEMFRVAGIVASGIALRFDYRKVIFSTSSDIKPDCDNVLIGSKAFVEEFLKQKEMEINIPGPFLKIAPLPVIKMEKKKGKYIKKYVKDLHHALLIVSGRNLDEIELAAKTIAILSFPFPDTDEMKVKEVHLPRVYPYTGSLMLTPGNKYTFNTLGFKTHTFKGMRPGPKDLTVRLPSDLLIKPNQYAYLYLHLAYGAGMRSDSSLNILLNGEYVTSIHLNDPHGAVFRDYKIAIPAYLFRRGYNQITFSPVLTPLHTGRCQLIQTQNLFLTLFDDSAFYFPEMPHWVDLPRIELFFQDGFPFLKWPDGRETILYLTQTDFQTLGAALNLIGLMSQKIGYPLFQIKATFQRPQHWKREIIVIGPVNTVPEDLRKLAPLKLLPIAQAPYPLLKNLKGEIIKSKWQKIKKAFLSIFHRKAAQPTVIMAFTKQISGLGPGRGAVMEFQSPYETGRSVLLLTAVSKKDLERLSKALLEPAVQANCHGDLALIDFTWPHPKVSALRVGKKYYTGKVGPISKLDIYLHTYFWLFFLLLMLLILFLGLTIFYLLKKHRQRRMEGEEETDVD